MTAPPDRLAALVGDGTDFPVVRTTDHDIERFDRAPRTLREVFVGTRSLDDRFAVRYQDEAWTYAEQWRVVATLARRLRDDFGVRHGDHVAIAVRNYPEWFFAFWATQVLGATTVALNAWLGRDELHVLLDDSRPIVVFADGQRVPFVQPSGNGAWAVIGVRADASDGPSIPLASLLTDPTDDLPEESVTSDDIATILYTSGTTSRPKGVVATHANHVANLLLLELRAEAGRNGGPQSAAPTLIAFPLFHVAGLSLLYSVTHSGRCSILLYKWDVEQALAAIDEHGITAYSGPPLTVRDLLDVLEVREQRAPLRSLGSGGALAPISQVRGIAGLYGGGAVGPVTGYGLTETTSTVASISGADYVDRPDSVGRPLPTVQVRIVDEELIDVPPGERGELLVRGPMVALRYFEMPAATAESFVDGWFRTGDLFRQDEEGYLYLVGRLKDVVIRGGENVSVGEVESVLSSHPSVSEVMVLGFPHRTLGEEVGVVVRVSEPVGEYELRTHAAERLAAFKVPTVIRFSDEPLPRNASGKLDKDEMRRMLGLDPL